VFSDHRHRAKLSTGKHASVAGLEPKPQKNFGSNPLHRRARGFHAVNTGPVNAPKAVLIFSRRIDLGSRHPIRSSLRPRAHDQ
jgi:hypothetical protein